MNVPRIAEWTRESLTEYSETTLWNMALACGDKKLFDRLDEDDDFDIVTLMLELKERIDNAKRVSNQEIFGGQTDGLVVVTGTGDNYEKELADLLVPAVPVSVLCTDDAMKQLSSAAAVIICLRFCGFTIKIKEIARKAYRHQIPLAVVFTDWDSFSLSGKAEILASIEKVGCEVAADMVFEENEMASFVCETMNVGLLNRNPELLIEGDHYGKPMRSIASVVLEGTSRVSLPPVKIDATDQLLSCVGSLFDELAIALLQTDAMLSWQEFTRYAPRPSYWDLSFDTDTYLPVARLCVIDHVLAKTTKKVVDKTLRGFNEPSLTQAIIESLPAQRQIARAVVLRSGNTSWRDVLVAAVRPVLKETFTVLMDQEPPVPARDGWDSFCNRVGVWLEARREETMRDFKERVVENINTEQTRLFEALLENKW
ncbi:MAG: hypothetical protein CMP20_02690 [Rickettsiales bacterium]|nr:hypothetical protein [Rickettsiales bacterium]